MPLSTSDKLGPYEILASIGAGGMGEVYRARDTRLRRDVAIKVSTERFSERFEIEARAIASLNHPNVCTLHDVGPNYLVMELVDGQTLAERIRQGAIPLDESLAIAKHIADALEAAHEKGIAHRDLKPGNIKITPGGGVKGSPSDWRKWAALPRLTPTIHLL
jgi:serine/threonine protein kinase